MMGLKDIEIQIQGQLRELAAVDMMHQLQLTDKPSMVARHEGLLGGSH